MYVSYCKKCNRFMYVSRISNYCKECKAPAIRVPMSSEEFFELPVNERYRLAYNLTNNK